MFTPTSPKTTATAPQSRRHPVMPGLLVLLVGLAAPAHATRTTVSTSSALLSAVASLASGDTIDVQAGTYQMDDDLVIQNIGSAYTAATVLRAVGGTVLLDCTLDYANTNLWAQHGQNNVYKATLTAPHIDLGETASSQVFVNDVLYTFAPDTIYTTLPAGYWTYNESEGKIYLHVTGNGNPGALTTVISNANRKDGIRVKNCHYFTIDGFTVRRSAYKGIFVEGTSDGSRADRVLVRNCETKENRKQGIYFRYTTDGSILSNNSHHNGSNGIHIFRSYGTNIFLNQSHYNDDHLPPRNCNGIRIGDSKDSLDADLITADFNVTHHNEDTGVEVRAARRVMVRGSVSYSNGDHGFDNNYVSRVTFINDVAFRNDHDGISVEDSAFGVGVFNTILAHNALNPATLVGGSGNVRELFVDNTTDFRSNNNVLVALTTGTITNGERHLVEWDADNDNVGRAEYNTLTDYQNGTGHDALSYATMPSFTADTTNGVFAITSASDNVIDAAKTLNIPGWQPMMCLFGDIRGFSYHDTVQPDVESSAGTTYADIGVYEFDPPPGAPTIGVPTGREDFLVTWVERGDDGDDFTAATHEVLVYGAGNGPDAAAAPATEVCYEQAYNPCSPISVQVKITDGNGQVAWSNVVSTSTRCTGNLHFECGEDGIVASGGDEESSTFSFEDGGAGPDVDHPLSLQILGQNPTRELTGIIYGIPKAMAGSPYELAMFDVSGRKVWAGSSGSAKAGQVLEGMSSRRGPVALNAGMYFVRLRIADKVLTRTVMLVP